MPCIVFWSALAIMAVLPVPPHEVERYATCSSFCMKFTGFEVFDDTIQRTNNWLKDLMQELNWSDRRKTYVVFRCVLHALRDHLSVRDAVYVGEQLPMLIRGAYYEHWEPSGN